MPTIEDYDPNEDEGSNGLGGGVASSPGQAASSPAAPKQQEYTPWSRFASANSAVSERAASDLQNQVRGDAQRAQKGIADAQAGFDKQIDSNYQQKSGNFAVDPYKQQAKAGQSNPFAPGSALNDGYQQVSGPAYRSTLTDAAKKNGPNAPKDLESSVGSDAWAGLTGQAVKAGAEANALGTAGGTQALLQAQYGQASSPFDAALVGGAGGKGFSDTARQFGQGQLTDQLTSAAQGAGDAWKKLSGDVTTAQVNQKRMADNAATEAFAAQQQDDLARGLGGGTGDSTQPGAGGASFDDLVKDTSHSMDAGTSGRRNTTNNLSHFSTWSGNQIGPGADAFNLAQSMMESAGLPGGGDGATGHNTDGTTSSDAQRKYWQSFLDSLPEGMRNFVNGMIANQDLAAKTIGVDEGGGLAPKSSDADWQWFQQLFQAYMRKNPPKGNGAQNVSGGLTSASTKAPK